MPSDSAVSSVPPSATTPSLPDPFSRLSRFDGFREAVEPLAAEFWAARQPLKAALVALGRGWDDRTGYAACCLVAGDELRTAGLSAFPSEQANAVELDAAPTPEQIATQAAWCVLAAAAAGDGGRVNELVEQLAGRPAVRGELDEVLLLVTDTCLAKWRCEHSPAFIDRLRAELTGLNLTPTEAMEWLHNGRAGLSPGARNALRGWLYAVETGRTPDLDDCAETWGPEVPGKPFRQWMQSGPVAEEQRDRKLAQIARQVQSLHETTQELFTLPALPSTPALPQLETAPATAPQPAPAPKRSTERGEGRLKLIAALTKYHQYADGSCLNTEPVGNNELARLAVVSESTASAFFNEKFQGHTKYRVLCRDASKLAAALKLLNGEFAPHLLYGGRPPEEDDRDDE